MLNLKPFYSLPRIQVQTEDLTEVILPMCDWLHPLWFTGVKICCYRITAPWGYPKFQKTEGIIHQWRKHTYTHIHIHEYTHTHTYWISILGQQRYLTKILFYSYWASIIYLFFEKCIHKYSVSSSYPPSLPL